MTFAVAGSVRSSLAARLDMAVLSLFHFWKPTPRLYAGNRGFVTAIEIIRTMPTGHRGHKKASRVAPARGRASCWGPIQDRRGQDAGISTVSITWITPFDWLTLEIVTIEVPPLASTIQILPSWCLTVSSSPSAVLSFLPSVRLE